MVQRTNEDREINILKFIRFAQHPIIQMELMAKTKTNTYNFKPRVKRLQEKGYIKLIPQPINEFKSKLFYEITMEGINYYDSTIKHA